eukprot:gene23895-biopygen20858
MEGGAPEGGPTGAPGDPASRLRSHAPQSPLSPARRAGRRREAALRRALFSIISARLAGTESRSHLQDPASFASPSP